MEIILGILIVSGLLTLVSLGEYFLNLFTEGFGGEGSRRYARVAAIVFGTIFLLAGMIYTWNLFVIN